MRAGFSTLRTELPHLLVIPFLTPHPVESNREFPRHGYLGAPSLSSHGQVEKPAPPVGVSADRDLGRLHQQKAQQRVTLLADVAQPSPIPAGLLRRHQPHIAGDLLAAAKAFWRSDDQFERQRRQRPHPQDGSSVAAPPVASPLPAPEPASVPEFSESVDPVTPTGLADVGWPTAPAPTTAVGLSPPVATAPSYAALLRSMPARATDS